MKKVSFSGVYGKIVFGVGWLENVSKEMAEHLDNGVVKIPVAIGYESLILFAQAVEIDGDIVIAVVGENGWQKLRANSWSQPIITKEVEKIRAGQGREYRAPTPGGNRFYSIKLK